MKCGKCHAEMTRHRSQARTWACTGCGHTRKSPGRPSSAVATVPQVVVVPVKPIPKRELEVLAGVREKMKPRVYGSGFETPAKETPQNSAPAALQLAEIIDARLSESEFAESREAHDRIFTEIGRALCRALLEFDVSLHTVRQGARVARPTLSVVSDALPEGPLTVRDFGQAFVRSMTDDLAKAADDMARARIVGKAA